MVPFRLRAGSVVLLVGYFLLAYFPLAQRAVAGPSVDTFSTWDAAIPFYPAAVWPYLLALPGLTLPLWLIARRSLFERTFVTAVLVMTVSYLMFFAFPTSSRHLLSTAGLDLSGPSGWLIGLLLRLDPPGNLAPSLHVSLATVALLSLSREQRGLVQMLVLAGYCAVVSSVCLLKQHYLIDALTGAALGSLLFQLTGRLRRFSDDG
jgi:hypothetical protein